MSQYKKTSSVSGLKTYMFGFLRIYKGYVISLMIMAILAGVFDVSVNYKIKEIIDIIAANQHTELNGLIFLFVLYKLMHHGSFFVIRLLDIQYCPRIIEQTVIDIYSKTVQHSLHWFDSHLSGEVSNKISDFQSSITDITKHLARCVAIVATIFVAFFFLVQVNVFAALVLWVFILVYSPVVYFLLKRQMRLQASYVNSRQKAVGIINDSITNIFGIKVIGSLLTEFNLKLKPAVSQWKLWDKKTRQFDAYCVDNADTFMIVIMSAVQIYLLAHFYQAGAITAGGFTFIVMMTLHFHTLLESFLEILLFNINPSIAQLRSSYSFLNAKVDVLDPLNPKELSNIKGAIEYRDVCFSYGGSKTQVLNGFNLKISPGEKVAIVGQSGVGKTTIIKCLLRYFDVSQGAILIDGHDIRDITQDSLRKVISIIPQDINLFHRSIKDNIRLAQYDATDEEIMAACKKAKIHEAIMAMDKGYDTIVGERGVKLSGGQRQRIAIARAFIKKSTSLLILDEATSSLDTPTETLIQESINSILETSPATVIAIAHRLSTLKHMDRIVVLDRRGIVEMGTHLSLIRKKDGLYKKLWEMQAI